MHNPKAALDQHFLKDDKIIGQIIKAAGIKTEDEVIEIGPGTGALTSRLPECNLILVEKDPDLIPELTRRFPKAIIIEADGVKFLKKAAKLNMILSSLPYSICEPLLQSLFTKDFKRAIFIVPAHFTELLEGKNTKFGLLADAFFDMKQEFKIPKDAFYPKPRVDSYLITIKPKKGFSIAKALYAQRDKKVKNAIREYYCSLGKTKTQAKEIVQAMELGEIEDKMGEKLTFEEYQSIIKKAK